MCDSDVDFDFDQLVSCDACGITVHQSCYGVAELPGVDDMWLCRACELKVRCFLPPVPLGRNACLLPCPVGVCNRAKLISSNLFRSASSWPSLSVCAAALSNQHASTSVSNETGGDWLVRACGAL